MVYIIFIHNNQINLATIFITVLFHKILIISNHIIYQLFQVEKVEIVVIFFFIFIGNIIEKYIHQKNDHKVLHLSFIVSL
jgi:hypothetical protein